MIRKNRNGFGKPKKPPGLAQRVAVLLGTAHQHKKSAETVFRSERHRRNVAAFCCINCGTPGLTQAAHINLSSLGKGTGHKVSDALVIPLCGPDLQNSGCHRMLDQSGSMSKEQSRHVQILWLMQTRRALIQRRQWPDEAEADFQTIVTPFLERNSV